MTGRLERLSLGVKLGSVVLAVVLVALGIVYVAVVPRLESRLVDAKLDDLERRTRSVAVQLSSDVLPFDPLDVGDRLRLLGYSNNARITVFTRLTSDSLRVLFDTQEVSSARDVADDPIAARAAASGRVERGEVERGGERVAEVAEPLGEDAVLLLSSSLEDALRSIGLVRNALLVAGAIALAIAWFAGSMAALRLVRRIRRLEGAAERIAAGDLARPVASDGQDELGDLATAFERMRRQLERLDSARRAFIANASHELRTPLFALGGFLELLEDEDIDDATRREFTEQMHQQVGRLQRLATDLLDLSRLDAGQLGVAPASVDLAECAATLAEEFRGAAEAIGHPLTLATVSAVAVADEQHVLRIGRALVENALRHTPAGTAVEIHAAPVAAGATLAVTDDGPGVPSGDRDRLFERFYRGTSELASGSGLGLAIARELAQRMDGTIEMVSRPGETTFTLRLPAAPPGTAFSRENAPDLARQV